MYNNIVAAGYLVADPELRDVKNNTKVCKLRLCISDNKAKTPCYIDAELWNKQAEIANEYLAKGRRIIINGELSLSSWEKDGKKYNKYFIRGENFKFISNESKDSNNGENSGTASSAQEEQDDVPF